MKRRVLKYGFTGLFVLLLGGLWAFSTFLFNPFEGRYEFHLSSLIPREVDFYVAKTDLSKDFDPFPRPAFADELSEDPNGQALLALPEVKDLLAKLKVEETLRPLEEVLAKLPVQTDPLGVFGGRALSVAGNFNGRSPDQAEWAVYGRASWLGKAAVEVVRSGLIDLESQGVSRTEIEDGVALAGGRLPRQLFLTRLQDVVVVATSPALIAKAHELEGVRGQNSFGQSAKYQDYIDDASNEGDELEAYVDYRALSENLRISGSWPDENSEDLLTAIAGRLFQVGSMREVMGTVAFGNGLTLDLSGTLSSEHMTTVQKSLYRQRGFDKADVLELARMVPADAGVFACLRGDVGDLLRQMAASAEAALVSNLEDVVRQVWGHPDLHPLIDDLDDAFKGSVAYFMRDNDYPPDESVNSPPHDDTPVPSWAVVLQINDAEILREVQQMVLNNQASFGIQGPAGQGGVFENTMEGGSKILEYFNPLVPGTGHIATLEMSGPTGTTYFLVSNSNRLLGQAFVTYWRRGSASLAEDSWFQTLVNSGLASANAVVWANPRAITETTRKLAEHRAEADMFDAIDWTRERPRIEKSVIKEHFPGEVWGAVSPENAEAYEMLVSQEADRYEIEFRDQHLPGRRALYLGRIDATEVLRAALIELDLDQKELHLYGRLVIPLGDAEAAP